ncbi:MAG: DUF3108 domain-containing protein [Saprospiraceae bacterium]
MKTVKYFAPLFCLFSMAFVLPRAQQPVETTLQNFEPCRSTNNTFQNGEVITYKIYYNLNFVWVPAGEVMFKVWDEGNQYHYQAIGQTYDSYEWFFTVKDRYDSWVDKNTLLPNYSEREVNEGDYHIFEKISFNQSNRKMTVWRSHKKGDAEKKTEHGVTDCVHDVLSSLYNLRTIDFASQAPGTAVPFKIFMDQEEFPLKMRYIGKDARKKVYGMGRYNTLKFQPDVIAGNTFDEDTKMTVWVSDDQNRIPLLIESPVSVGSVKMVIKEYSGLKYDFTAKVK